MPTVLFLRKSLQPNCLHLLQKKKEEKIHRIASPSNYDEFQGDEEAQRGAARLNQSFSFEVNYLSGSKIILCWSFPSRSSFEVDDDVPQYENDLSSEDEGSQNVKKLPGSTVPPPKQTTAFQASMPGPSPLTRAYISANSTPTPPAPAPTPAAAYEVSDIFGTKVTRLHLESSDEDEGGSSSKRDKKKDKKDKKDKKEKKDKKDKKGKTKSSSSSDLEAVSDGEVDLVPAPRAIAVTPPTVPVPTPTPVQNQTPTRVQNQHPFGTPPSEEANPAWRAPRLPSQEDLNEVHHSLCFFVFLFYFSDVSAGT